MYKRSSTKAFTILELLVVVAIIAILAVIAIPNFIGKLESAKASQNLAEINAVEKAISTYYAENGTYPTLQSKDGTLLQPQPIEGAPHNIDFSSLVPNYLVSLPHFSYWWVDFQGNVYHTEKPVGAVVGGVFTPTEGYAYTVYKTNGTKQVLSAPYTLQTGEYILGTDDKGSEMPIVGLAFKNAKMHPEDPEYVASIPVTGVTLSKTTTSIIQGTSEVIVETVLPSTATNKSITWTSSNTAVASVDSSGKIVGVSTGSATITAKTVDGNKTATCVVTVVAPFTSQTFSYSGNVQTFTVPVTGVYRLEVWGAQGGINWVSAASATTDRAAGGYAKGNITLTSGQVVYVYVGGRGGNGPDGAGWNGGGAGAYVGWGSAAGGGGATDIRIGGQALSNRKIVGGGAGGSNYVVGGAGGGLTGSAGSSMNYGIGGSGGTQTSGGAGGGTNGMAVYAGLSGTLGVGANATWSGANGGSAGGGGYYGGGASSAGGSHGGGGGGGSSYIGGVTNGETVTGINTSGHGRATITYVSP